MQQQQALNVTAEPGGKLRVEPVFTHRQENVKRKEQAGVSEDIPGPMREAENVRSSNKVLNFQSLNRVSCPPR
jgi:hypothetical protein